MLKKVVFIWCCLSGLMFANSFHFYTAGIALASESQVVGVAKFSDINDSHWAKSAIYEMAGKGAVAGFPDGTFRPDAVITADQFITMMIMAHTEIYEGGVRDWNAAWWENSGLYNQTKLANQNFDFKPGAAGYWAQSYINQAVNMGFLKLSDGVFEGNYKGYLTRENAAMLLDAWITYYEPRESVRYVDLAKQGITDYHAITQGVNGSVLHSMIKGVLRGYPDKTFRPNRLVTRAEAIKMVQSLADKSVRRPFKPDLTGTFHTSLTWKDGSERVVVFQTKEFLDATKIIEQAGSQTKGASRGDKMHFSFYKDDETIDTYEKGLEQSNTFKVSPLEMGFGIAGMDNIYELGLHINESYLTIHKEAYDKIILFLFGEQGMDFKEKVITHSRKYKKEYPNPIKGEVYKINGREVRLSPLLGTERIYISISEKR